MSSADPSRETHERFKHWESAENKRMRHEIGQLRERLAVAEEFIRYYEGKARPDKTGEPPSSKQKAWRCPKCGHHMVAHGIVKGRPVCPTQAA